MPKYQANRSSIQMSRSSNYRRLLVMLMAMVLPIESNVSTASASADDLRSIPTIAWSTTINKFQFDSEKFVGQRLTVRCPPAAKDLSLAGIHGTDLYPSESAICVAALHAGKITREGGIVTIQLNPGEKKYLGSERNGVQSTEFPATKRSISFVDDTTAVKIDDDRLAMLPLIDWDTKFTRSGFAYRHLMGQRFSFRCPAAPLDRQMRIVFGTDSYDFSSFICQAALHAGKLTKAGGVVTVQIDGKVPKLEGSIRNGVETRSKHGSDRTISFVDTPANNAKDN